MFYFMVESGMLEGECPTSYIVLYTVNGIVGKLFE